MSRQDGNIVSQRKQLRLNSLEQLLAINPGKVPTTNASGKQNIAANQKLFAVRKNNSYQGNDLGPRAPEI